MGNDPGTPSATLDANSGLSFQGLHREKRTHPGSLRSLSLIVRNRDGDVAGRGVARAVSAGDADRIDAAVARAGAVGAEIDRHAPGDLGIAALQRLVRGDGDDVAASGDIA